MMRAIVDHIFLSMSQANKGEFPAFSAMRVRIKAFVQQPV
jgi:hypothetical protein